MDVCDEGFLAWNPQRFMNLKDERINPGQFELEATDAKGGKGKWFYESREKPGKPVSVSIKNPRAGKEGGSPQN